MSMVEKVATLPPDSKGISMRLRIAHLAAVGLAFTLAGCSAQAVGSSPDPSSVDSAAVVNLQSALEPTSLDISTTSGAALQQLLIGNVYEGLVAKGANNEIVPALATSWSVSPDGLKYDFTLRDGVSFQDGSAFDMEDVVTSFNALIDKASVNPDAAKFSAVKSVVGLDGNTFEILLSSRNINFLDLMTSTGGLVYSSLPGADRASTTNGTGPYTVTQWNKGSTISLARNDQYWGEAPKNAGAVFHYIKDPTTASNALTTGGVDLLLGANAETAQVFSGQNDFTVTKGDSTSWMTLSMNNKSGALADVRVRKAIRMGIDKAGLISVIGGNAIQVGTMSVPTDPWYEDLTSDTAYDPSSAKKLLADAGYANGLSFTLIVSNTYDTKITEYIAAQLAEIGVNVTINSVEFSTWLATAFQAKNYEMTMVLHVDPWTLTNYGNPKYYFNYDSPEAKILVANALVSKTFAERNDNLKKLAELLNTDAVSDWLYSPQTIIVSNNKVTGFPFDRISNHFLLSGIQVTK